MHRLKRSIKNAIARCGYDVRRRQPYGSDLFLDIHKILGSHGVQMILDVGANTGGTAALFAQEFPGAQIHSFEPNPQAFAQLSAVAAGSPKITPHRKSLGAASGQRTLHVTRSNLTSSLLAPSAEARHFLGELVDAAGDLTVEGTSVDDFLREQKIAWVDLLKLDVQGYELEVLKGAEDHFAGNHLTLIIAEVNFVPLYEQQAYFHEVYQHLISRGFKLVGLYDADYRAGPYLAWCDALFISPAAMERRKQQAVT